MSAIFEAKYPGLCGGCDDRIKEGDRVMYDEDDELIHATCDGSTFADLVTESQICPEFWLVHAGYCF